MAPTCAYTHMNPTGPTISTAPHMHTHAHNHSTPLSLSLSLSLCLSLTLFLSLSLSDSNTHMHAHTHAHTHEHTYMQSLSNACVRACARTHAHTRTRTCTPVSTLLMSIQIASGKFAPCQRCGRGTRQTTLRQHTRKHGTITARHKRKHGTITTRHNYSQETRHNYSTARLQQRYPARLLMYPSKSAMGRSTPPFCIPKPHAHVCHTPQANPSMHRCYIHVHCGCQYPNALDMPTVCAGAVQVVHSLL